MKRRRIFIAVLVVLAAPSAVPAVGAAAPNEERSYIVIAREEHLPAGFDQDVAAIGGGVTYAISQIGAAVVTSGDPDFAAAAATLPGVRSVVPDVAIPLEEPLSEQMAFEPAGIGNPPTSGDDDVLFDLQWALDAIDAPEAWDAGARGAGVRVAVIDSGIDTDHPDLAPNLNLGLSTSFIPGVGLDPAPNPGAPFPASSHHGTWTAGIIGAADNGVGTIGVAPEAEIVAVRVCRDPPGFATCPLGAILAGIVYSAAIGSDVINQSLAAFFPRRAFRDADGNLVPANQVAELLAVFRRAYTFARSQGSTVVVPAGNEAMDLDADAGLFHGSGDFPQVITVSATGPLGWGQDPTTDLDLPAFYTNFGQSVVDFAAPGGGNGDLLAPPDPLCPVPGGGAVPCFLLDRVVGPTTDGWTLNFGTSASAPHVAGVAALIVGANGAEMHPAAVEAALRASADDLGKPGVDDFYGHGRVNAANAVE